MMLLNWNKLFSSDTLFQEGSTRERDSTHMGDVNKQMAVMFPGHTQQRPPKNRVLRSSNSRIRNWMLICARRIQT